MFKENEISHKDLLLDPNNPRFSKHKDQETPTDQISLEAEQQKAYDEMMLRSNGFEIKDLATSIKEDGFLPVDKIFVTKIAKTNKYLVIEGNRRITAIKFLIKNHETGKEAHKLSPELLESFEKIPCAEVSSDNEELVQRILGLRHHGSIKPWKPLPASYNLYSRYMKAYCRETGCEDSSPSSFEYVPSIAKSVAAASSVKLSDLRNKIRTYRVYLQLIDYSTDPELVEDEDNYSKIFDTIKDTKLAEFFEFDSSSATLTDEGCERFIDLCIGDGDKLPVITAAAAGESNLRDLKYVLDKGDQTDLDKIVIERRKASEIKSAIITKETKENITDNLKSALNSLGKIDLGDIPEGLADGEKKIVKEIESKLGQLLRAANE